jgi:integrase
MKKYKQLTSGQRYQIYGLKQAGLKQSQIAEKVGVDKSTISREFRRNKGGLVIRLHDLRHEAASRLFEKGLNVMEAASMTGHKTLSMLKRYTHLNPTDIAKKLGETVFTGVLLFVTHA